MSLIDKSYFIGSINIDTSRNEVSALLDLYIAECEEKYLRDLMGDDMYYDYTVNAANQNYIDLISGKIFAVNGIPKNYTGVKQMLAYFTYYRFLTDMKSYNTVLGDVTGSVQNADSVLPVQKLNTAWNNGVKLYQAAQYFIASMNGQTAGTYPYYVASEKIEANQFGV